MRNSACRRTSCLWTMSICGVISSSAPKVRCSSWCVFIIRGVCVWGSAQEEDVSGTKQMPKGNRIWAITAAQSRNICQPIGTQPCVLSAVFEYGRRLSLKCRIISCFVGIRASTSWKQPLPRPPWHRAPGMAMINDRVVRRQGENRLCFPRTPSRTSMASCTPAR